MSHLVLGPMLRHVSSTSATIWVETDRACTVEICGHRTATFTVLDHHYALVIIEGLEPGSTTPYEVFVDGERAWPPPTWTFPPSVIRTLGDGPTRILFGSCRAAAPHEPPWTLDLAHDERARGVDALYAHGLRMLEQDPSEWPHLLLFVGDQVYADDSSPGTRERVRARRGHLADRDDQPSISDVADFEEYTWLYHESWLPEVERWVLSVVPSAMIFDDHDMIDDWNTSMSWVEDIRSKPWWQEHVTGGLMSYWIYQHLGNQSPEQIREEGMLERFVEMGDASDALREWAERSEEFTPVPGGYRFSYERELGPVRLVVIDSRNGRVLTPGARRMVDDDEWHFVRSAANRPCEHLVLATSIPAVMPGGLHELERWNELVSEGAWGRWFTPLGEKVRRALDLEDWAAFHDSYLALMELLREVATPGEPPAPQPPATVTIVSGDVHFSFRATATFPDEPDRPRPASRVYQIVNSPIRNVLAARERRAMQLGLSRVGKWIGRALRRSARAHRDDVEWTVDEGPFFANHMCLLEFTERDARMVLERADSDDGGRPRLTVAAEASL
ncbi:MAG: alkaline phosphatase family protein [Ilumatobacteraceae bacterium]